jgi:hypothetical protein
MKPNREPRSAAAVMADVKKQLPALASHCYLDRSWIWYCGPALSGDKNKATRETLSLLGFRYAPRGHVMQDGTTQGSWSHSCDHPLRRFKGGSKNHNQPETDHAEPTVESILAGCDV